MAIQHKNITEVDLHEPKGASTAVLRTVYASDGVGSGTWQYYTAHGSISYVDFTTGTTLVAPTAYARMNPTTVASGSPIEFTEATTATLTYTGTAQRHLVIRGNVSVAKTGVAGDISIAVYKNGAIISSSEIQQNATTTDRQNIVIQGDVVVVQNDYFDVYVKCAVGNIVIYSLHLYAEASL